MEKLKAIAVCYESGIGLERAREFVADSQHLGQFWEFGGDVEWVALDWLPPGMISVISDAEHLERLKAFDPEQARADYRHMQRAGIEHYPSQPGGN
jgi:hypothetical protein